MQNLFWVLFYDYDMVAMLLATVGILHPITTDAAMALGSVNVVTNSFRLRRARRDLTG